MIKSFQPIRFLLMQTKRGFFEKRLNAKADLSWANEVYFMSC
jgi:hypothetical protein